jgi:hypothetical protein
MKAARRMPRLSKVVDVNGMIALDAVPHDDMSCPGLVAMVKAARLRAKEVPLCWSVTWSKMAKLACKTRSCAIRQQACVTGTYMIVADQIRAPPRAFIINSRLVCQGCGFASPMGAHISG